MEGWILLHRKLISNWVWNNPKYLKGWIHCLMRANYKETKIPINGEIIVLNKGEFITSLHKFSTEVGMSPQEVRTFWKLLEQDQMIVKNSTSKLTKLTVCNYGSYQDVQQSDQQSSNKPATTEKEIKEGKEVSPLTPQGEVPEKKKKKKTSPTLTAEESFTHLPEGILTPKFKHVWIEWWKYRKSEHWSTKQSYAEKAARDLVHLAGGNPSTAIKIVEQSMAKGWQGLFRLKEEYATRRNMVSGAKSEEGTKVKLREREI